MRRGGNPGWNGRGGSYGRGRGFFPRNRGSFQRGRGTPAVKSSSATPVTLSQPMIRSVFPVITGPYKGWNLYFPNENYSENSETVRKVQAAEHFISSNKKHYSHIEIEERRSFVIDMKILLLDQHFINLWDRFTEDLVAKPEHSLNCLGLAMHQMVLLALIEDVRKQIEDVAEELPPIDLPIIRARLVNFEPITQLKNLKANFYGKLVSVKGTIIRVGNVKLLCTWMAFTCNTCKSIQCCKQADGIYSQPSSCVNNNCKARSFTPCLSSPLTQTINWQSVRLQELLSDDHREGGRIPRTIECELTEDMLDCCIPGDVITITGIVKVRSNDEGISKNSPSMFSLYIEAASIVNSKNLGASGSTSTTGTEFNTRDYHAIRKIHAEPNIFCLLVNSLCPAIYGHEMVKAGLLLALFGGVSEHIDGRGDPHVLVVGDPGLGKSQMLRACANIAPRGVYVCGNTSTASGLTVTLTRESGGNYALEAGALVLADQGCCCIDEFDKMAGQHQALLEAMEQQSISIAKAGVVCSLPARTTVLAAANPVGGHYNRGKTVSENLRLGAALLSRFDLVFVLLDRPDQQLDSLLSEHVMALHGGLKHKSSESTCSSTISAHNDNSQHASLQERLKSYITDSFDPVPHQLLRKYVGYARKYVNPRISARASDVLQEFYLQLRRKHQAIDCTPITMRQLQSLIRLTQARARLELREEANEQDAHDIIQIMQYSLFDTLTDNLGNLDFRRSQHGSGLSKRGNTDKFIAVLERFAKMKSSSLFTINEMKDAMSTANIQVPNFLNLITSLNHHGYLLKKGPQLYKLLTVDY